MDNTGGKHGWNIDARTFEPRLLNENQSEENFNLTQSDHHISNNIAGNSAQFTGKLNGNQLMPYYLNGCQSNDLVAQFNNIALSSPFDISHYLYTQSLLSNNSFQNSAFANRVPNNAKSSIVAPNIQNPYLHSFQAYNRINPSQLMTMPYNILQATQPNTANAAGRSKRNSCTVNKVFNTGDAEIDKHLTESYKTINPRSDFNRDLSHSKFFVIKSYTEEHVHRSIKYGEWCSTQRGNEVLDKAYRSVQAQGGHVYLFFSVNSSGYFCGVAQMTSECDSCRRSSHWNDDKWQGGFLVQWLYVKDVPNKYLKHIILEYNDNRPITNSRDATEMKPPQKGYETLRLMHEYHHNSSLFDDFEFYETREKECLNNNNQIPTVQ